MNAKNTRHIINIKDEKVKLIEYICHRIVEELNASGLSLRTDDFLDDHVMDIMDHIQDPKIKNKHVMEG